MSMQVINHRRLKGQGLLSLPSPPYLLRIVSSRFRSKLTRLQSGFQDSKQYLFFDSCSEIDFSGFLAPHEGSPLGKRRVFILYKFQSTTYNNFSLKSRVKMNFKLTYYILYLSYSSIFDAATENRGVFEDRLCRI